MRVADRVVAFWDGVSRGTAHSLGLARQQGKLRPEDVWAVMPVDYPGTVQQWREGIERVVEG